MVARNGALKILDFGLATPSMRGLSASACPPAGGTRAYMAPEQGRHEAVDARADVYALGVLMHELLTNELPNRGEPLLPRAIPRAVKRIVTRCLAHDPEDRYGDAGAVHRALVASKAARR